MACRNPRLISSERFPVPMKPDSTDTPLYVADATFCESAFGGAWRTPVRRTVYSVVSEPQCLFVIVIVVVGDV